MFALYYIQSTQVWRTNKCVLIFGASSGASRTLAHMFAQRGARVCVAGQRKKEIREVRLEGEMIQRIEESERGR